MLTLALLVPTITHATSGITLLITGLIVGIQAAQSSYVQVAPSEIRRHRQTSVVLTSIALASGCIAAVAPNPFTTTVVSTAAGALLGVPLGIGATRVLATKGGLSYQLFQTQRSALILVATIVVSTGSQWNAALATGCGVVLIGAGGVYASCKNPPLAPRSAAGPAGARASHRVTHVWVLLGLCTSLFYRNDTTWVRASVASRPDFDQWHVALVAYVAVQGLVGFVVVQRIFAKREQVANRLLPVILRYRWFIAVMWAFLAGAALLLGAHGGTIASVLMAASLAVIIGFISAISHVLRVNWAPYLAGTIGTTILLICMWSNVETEMLLIIGNSVTGAVLVASLFSVRSEEWRS